MCLRICTVCPGTSLVKSINHSYHQVHPAEFCNYLQSPLSSGKKINSIFVSQHTHAHTHSTDKLIIGSLSSCTLSYECFSAIKVNHLFRRSEIHLLTILSDIHLRLMLSEDKCTFSKRLSCSNEIAFFLFPSWDGKLPAGEKPQKDTR